MIYIKYTNKSDLSFWFICAPNKWGKEETHILDCYGNTYQYYRNVNLAEDKKYWKIDYLTQEEVEQEIDLLKLELL